MVSLLKSFEEKLIALELKVNSAIKPEVQKASNSIVELKVQSEKK